MEELQALREHIQQGRTDEALLLIDELEEMSREDKLNKIYSYAVVLLVHLIKRQAEQRTTRSWDVSIFQAVHQIQRVNERRRAGGVYAGGDELREILEEAFDLATRKAALEVLEGRHDEQELLALIDKNAILEEAMGMLVDRG